MRDRVARLMHSTILAMKVLSQSTIQSFVSGILTAILFHSTHAYAKEITISFPKKDRIILRSKELYDILQGSESAEEVEQELSRIEKRKADYYCLTITWKQIKGKIIEASKWKSSMNTSMKNQAISIPGSKEKLFPYVFDSITCTDQGSLLGATQSALNEVERFRRSQSASNPPLCAREPKQPFKNKPRKAQETKKDVRETQSHEVADIDLVRKVVQESIEKGDYQSDEILVIFDVDQTLTRDFNPVTGETTPRENAQNTVKALSHLGVQMIASSACPSLDATLLKLKNLGLSTEFQVNSGRNGSHYGIRNFRDQNGKRTPMEYMRNGNVVSVRKAGSDFNSPYVQKALAPAIGLDSRQLKKIKKVVFVDDLKKFHEIFKNDAHRFLPFGNQLEEIHTIQLQDPSSLPKPELTKKRAKPVDGIELDPDTMRKADSRAIGQLHSDERFTPDETYPQLHYKYQNAIRIFQRAAAEANHSADFLAPPTPGFWFSESLAGGRLVRIYYVDYDYRVKLFLVNVDQKPYSVPSVILSDRSKRLFLKKEVKRHLQEIHQNPRLAGHR